NPIIRGYANYFGVAEVTRSFRKLDKWLRMRVRSFRLKRRVRTANRRLPTKKLVKWGMLSLLDCRPKLRFSYTRSFVARERPRLLAMRHARWTIWRASQNRVPLLSWTGAVSTTPRPLRGGASVPKCAGSRIEACR